MTASPDDTRSIRLELLLNPNMDRQRYEELRKLFLSLNEERWLEAYDDYRVRDKTIRELNKRGEKIKGNVTVGIGFNMGHDKSEAGKNRKEEARKEWAEAFKSFLVKDTPNFDVVFAGRLRLTEAQVDQLFHHSITIREKELRIHFKGVFQKLSLNERLAAEDIYYQLSYGGFFHGEPKLYERLHDYVHAATEKGKQQLLNNLLWHITRNLKPNHGGHEKRRLAQAEMMNTYGWDLNTLTRPTPLPKVLEKPRAEAESYIAGRMSDAIDAAEFEVLRTVGTSLEMFERSIEELTGIKPQLNEEGYLPQVLEMFIGQYQEAMTILKDRLLSKLESLIEDGTPLDRILSAIQELRKVVETNIESRRHALAFYFHGQLTKLRQQAYGITHYTWRSQDDEKVRPAHAANDDQIFAWNDPPDTGHPGHEYGCRCYAEPVLSVADNKAALAFYRRMHYA